MKTKFRKKHDYKAELDLPSDKLICTLKKLLKQKYGLDTKRVTDNTNQFLSEDRKHSFRKTVIDTIPAQIEWCVESLSSTQCRFSMYFPLPLWLRFRFYLAFFSLSFLFFAAVCIILRYHGIDFEHITDPVSIIFLLTIFTVVITAVVFFAIAFLYLRLLSRYIEFGRGVLVEVSEVYRNAFGLSFKKGSYGGRSLIDWKAIAVILGTLFCYYIALLKEYLQEGNATLIADVIVPIVCAIIILLYLVALKKQKRGSLITKGSSIAFNLCLGSFVVFLLLVVPIVIHELSTSAIDCVSSTDIGSPISAGRQTVASSQSITWSTTVLARMRLIAFWMCFVVCLPYLMGLTILLGSSKELEHGYSSMMYNARLKETFYAEILHASEGASLSLRLSSTTKFVLVFFILLMTIMCWAGLLINMSLVNALIFPDCRVIPISYGWTIAEGTMLMSSAIVGGRGEDRGLHVLRMILLAPALFPFVLFIILHIRALRLSYIRYCLLTPLTNSIAVRVNEVAAHIGVSEVSCFLDKRSNCISPYATVRGWYPRNMIIFSQRSLSFLSDYPKHVTAVLAHEVAHLKCDCLRLWILRLLSRLSLVGVGCLSIFHDSVAMEDRADDITRHYLRENGEDENLLTEAAYIFEAQDYLNDNLHGSAQEIAAGFMPVQNLSTITFGQAKEPFLKKLTRALRIAHDVYFQAEIYDYIHRQAKYRCIKPDQKANSSDDVK